MALHDEEVQGVLTLAATLVLFASLFYKFVEGWSLLDSVYFSVVTISTIGYGDFAPQTTLGKLFTIFYVCSGMGLFATAVATIARATIRNGGKG